MTDPKQHWRVEPVPTQTDANIYQGEEFVAHFSSAVDAAHVVALHNDAKIAGLVVSPSAETLAASKRSGYVPSWLDGAEMFARQLKAAFTAAHPHIAAPPAPEPPAEVEWRVSEEDLNREIRILATIERSYRLGFDTDEPSHPQLEKLRYALDLCDARAALARRPDPSPATSASDETLAVLDEIKTRFGVARNSDVPRRVLADAKKTVDGCVLPSLTDPAPATPVIDETRRFLENWPDSITASPAQINRLRAILAEHDTVFRTGAGGWLPIESVPKDGTGG